MIEPLTTAAIAIGTIVATKALEKTTERATEAVLDKTGLFITSLEKKSPDTVTAIQKAPLNYGKIVPEVAAIAKTNPEVAQRMQELVEAVEAESVPNLADILREIADTLKSHPTTVQNLTKLADKIGIVVQGGTVNIDTFNV